MHITPLTSTVANLLGTPNEQFVIPSYQRRYSWRKEQLLQLVDDINMIEDGDAHLLGSIVCLIGPHSGALNKLELVDGQQRLTTISIILECLRERFAQEAANNELQILNRLLEAKAYGGPSVAKIALDTMDGQEFQQLVKEPYPDPPIRYMNKKLEDVFNEMRGWVADQTTEHLKKFLDKLLYSAPVVRLEVSNAKDAFKLFETINNRGLKLSPADIIKNFVLGNAARFGAEQLEDAKSGWSKIMRFLDGTDADAFFRYFLISRLQTRLTKSWVVAEFQALFMSEVLEAEKLPDRHFYAYEEEFEEEEVETEDASGEAVIERRSAQISFTEFLQGLVRAAKAYGELIRTDTSDVKINRHLRNLKMIKATQTYGFLMHLRVGGVDDRALVEVLKLTENFLLRRHVCRERANETETLFAHLCEADPEDPIPAVLAAYREATPSDEKFKEDFAEVQFTSNILDRARYCLEQFELARHGQHQELGVLGTDSVHVEHIIPQKIVSRRNRAEYGDWVEYLGTRATQRHPREVSRIGNLTLFAGSLNIVSSNNPFSEKKANYKLSSILITKELASLQQFKFSQVETRSRELAEVAVKLWPAP